jgi:hypothetical protein
MPGFLSVRGHKKLLIPEIVLLLMLAFMPESLKAQETVRHELNIVLYPEEQRFTATDTVTVPESIIKERRFLLHGGLTPTSSTPGVQIVQYNRKEESVSTSSYRIILPPGKNSFVLQYGGRIYYPLESFGKERARGFKQTPGIISSEGVYLSGSSYWYPSFGEEMVTFTLQVELPSEWTAVSQGGRTLNSREKDSTIVRWESPEIQEEIFLVAAPFTEYRKIAGRSEAMVFLRTPDEKLASKYLEATVSYLALYENLIGTYPYRKFALVENFWETGYGMPSFTLLGPKIIRFPFILRSSYPHEILHNWLGNSVFPDYSKGNWAEGLTAYLSDYLVKEQRNKGVEYRQTSLQKYADYVLSGRDFPLTQFRARHSSSSEAIGYGKSLMFFHMLRQTLGDKIFIKGIQDFYRKNKFRSASFDDLRVSFEDVSEKDLRSEFKQWITLTGAPQLKVSNPKVNKKGDRYFLTALLEQIQQGPEYHLRIPVAVTIEGQDRAFQAVIVMEKKRLEMVLSFPSRPLRFDIDPEFDIFRRLDRAEFPPALTQAFGAKRMLILLPSSAGKNMLGAYRGLAQAIGNSGPDEVEVLLDTEVENLPSDRAVTIIGWENRFLGAMVSAISGYDVTIKQTGARIGQTMIKKEQHSVAITARHPNKKDLSLTWIATDRPEALPGLGRKLPHYHKYSYLVFEGIEPENIAKGRWPVNNSPMTVFIPDRHGKIPDIKMGKLADRKPLATLPPVFSRERIMETVRFLSSEDLKGRGFGTEELDRAAQFIASKFQEAGLLPGGDSEKSYFQTWQDNTSKPGRSVIMKNVVGIIPGKSSEMKDQSVVLGAHYDHLGFGWPEVREEKHRGKIHPGADDNSSGVAVLFELALVLAKTLKPDRSLVFVAFTGEELGKKGSKYYVENQKRYPAGKCIGMLNIDTVGRLGKRKLLVLGAGSASEWVHIFTGAGYVTGVDLQVVSEELDSSDQKSFQDAGVPAVQLFSGPHLDYHRPTDTADKVDPEGLLKVASVAKEVVEYLAAREGPMTTVRKPGESLQSMPNKERKVSLGTIPDFTFRGKGFRLSGVVPGSPAEKSGLRKGDVIIMIGLNAVRNLRDFSDVLKSLKPGDRITITFIREGKEMTMEAEVKGK